MARGGEGVGGGGYAVKYSTCQAEVMQLTLTRAYTIQSLDSRRGDM